MSKLKCQMSNPNLKSKNCEIQVINPYSGGKIRLGAIALNSLWPTKEWVAERIGDTSVLADFSLRPEGRGLKPARTESILGAKTTHSKLNDFSLVFLLEYGGRKILLMGDADSQVQDDISQVNSLTAVDILKLPHHGSKTGMAEKFLEHIRPKEAVISVGKNSYGHPAQETLDLLKKFNVMVRRTDIEGDINYKF